MGAETLSSDASEGSAAGTAVDEGAPPAAADSAAFAGEAHTTEPAPAPAPSPAYSAAPTPSSSGPSADDIARAFARENAQTLGPILQRLEPKPTPQKQPWDDPDAFWNMTGVPENRMSAEFQRRVDQFVSAQADARAQAAIDKALEAQNQRFAQALAWQEAQFRARYAQDPAFGRIEAHYQRYVSEGVPPAYARRLAEADAGVASAARPAPAPVGVPAVPRHATSPATRTAAPASAAAKGKWTPPVGDADRTSSFRTHFDQIADRLGVD